MSKDKLCLKFTINNNGELFSTEKNDMTVMNCSFVEGVLDFWILYDYNEAEPLHLVGSAKTSDKVKINILPHRIELYIDDFLEDEEWPCGKHFVSDATVIKGDCNVSICDIDAAKKHEPSILGSFKNAEGWRPEENVFVGDCMPYVHDGRYHVLYLKDRHHHKSKWGKGAHQWSHVSTGDFENWSIHPMAVEIESPEEGSICTGSWICNGEVHYLFYTIRPCDNSPAKICRSVSNDGFHFEKDKNFSFTLSDKYTASTARDPKIFKTDDGVYHMILTTSLNNKYRGCLAHLTSKDLNEWKELEEPFFVSPMSYEPGAPDYYRYEPECPDYFYKDGYYYLVYSLGGNGHYLYSENPLSDWQTPQNPIIPCKSVPKAAIWNDKIIFAGYEEVVGGYAGTMTFLEAVVRTNGELTYKKLD